MSPGCRGGLSRQRPSSLGTAAVQLCQVRWPWPPQALADGRVCLCAAQDDAGHMVFRTEDGTVLLELCLDETCQILKGIGPRTMIINRTFVLKLPLPLFDDTALGWRSLSSLPRRKTPRRPLNFTKRPPAAHHVCACCGRRDGSSRIGDGVHRLSSAAKNNPYLDVMSKGRSGRLFPYSRALVKRPTDRHSVHCSVELPHDSSSLRRA